MGEFGAPGERAERLRPVRGGQQVIPADGHGGIDQIIPDALVDQHGPQSLPQEVHDEVEHFRPPAPAVSRRSRLRERAQWHAQPQHLNDLHDALRRAAEPVRVL